MKYAAEVMELLGAYPGKKFRMALIVRRVASDIELRRANVKRQGGNIAEALKANNRERDAARKAVIRVLDSLIESGVVQHQAPQVQGGFALYWWSDRRAFPVEQSGT